MGKSEPHRPHVMGDCPHGRVGRMGKWAHIGKMNPDGKKRTKIEKRTKMGQNEHSEKEKLVYTFPSSGARA